MKVKFKEKNYKILIFQKQLGDILIFTNDWTYEMYVFLVFFNKLWFL